MVCAVVFGAVHHEREGVVGVVLGREIQGHADEIEDRRKDERGE